MAGGADESDGQIGVGVEVKVGDGEIVGEGV